jgi:hypothetical protein
MPYRCCIACLLASCGPAIAATTPHPFGRPLIPDMVADASIVDVDGVFYCYATTDGWGKHLSTSGTPVVWKSLDGVKWEPYGGHDEVILRSPHRDQKSVHARYLRLTVLKGEPGLWEFRAY